MRKPLHRVYGDWGEVKETDTEGSEVRKMWCGDALEWLEQQERIPGAVITSLPGPVVSAHTTQVGVF